MFTQNKIEEIKSESTFEDMSKDLPQSLVNILMKLQGKVIGIYYNVLNS